VNEAIFEVERKFVERSMNVGKSDRIGLT